MSDWSIYALLILLGCLAGQLKERRGLLEAQLAQRDVSLSLWRRKEQDHKQEVELMRRRVDEMARVIRCKELEIERHRYVEAKQLEEIRQLSVRLKVNIVHRF